MFNLESQIPEPDNPKKVILKRWKREYLMFKGFIPQGNQF